MMRLPAALLAAVMALAAAGVAQEGAGGIPLHVSVTAPDGARVVDLRQEEFEVRVEGVRQPIVGMSTGPLPLRIVLLIDTTTRPQVPEEDLRSMVAQVTAALTASDLALVGRVGREIAFGPAFTREPRALAESARQAVDPRDEQRSGPSPIWDAIIDAVERLRPEQGRRAILLITDGRGTGNRHGLAEAAQRAMAANVSVNVVAVTSPSTIFAEGSIVRVHPERMVEAVAGYTGGAFLPKSALEMKGAAAALASVLEGLRHEYTLTISPAVSVTLRGLEIRVNRPGLTMRARRSFTR